MEKENLEHINRSVVRIYAEIILIDFKLPYVISNPHLGFGSGTLIHKDGYILSCFHVVKDARNVYIDIPYVSSEKYLCEIISVCPEYDLALLKIKKRMNHKYILPLSTETWTLEIGMKVYAVGYPANMHISGSGNTLKITAGIISGQHGGFIQTDTAINPGNSGGPLLYNNTIIGVNVIKLVGGFDNIGYAVPVHRFFNIWDEMMKTRIVHPLTWNIDYNETTEEILSILTHGKVKTGIQISFIYENSFMSIMEKGDILIQINEFEIQHNGNIHQKWLGNEMDIYRLLEYYNKNKIISIEYYSMKKKKKTTKKIQLKEEQYIIRTYYPMYEKIEYIITCGMTIMNLSLNILTEILGSGNQFLYPLLKYNEKKNCNEKCVIVVNIFPNSCTYNMNNITIFSILSKVNYISVYTLSDVQKALQKPVLFQKKKYIHIENQNGRFVMFDLKKVIHEDKNLSEIYKYPIVKNQYGKQYA